MAVDSSRIPAVSADPGSRIAGSAGESTFEERWAAWQARGAAHDRAVRRRIAIVAPVIALVAIILYGFLAL